MGWDFSKNPMYDAYNPAPSNVATSMPWDNVSGSGWTYQPLDARFQLDLGQTLWDQGDSQGAFGDAYKTWKAEQDTAASNFQWTSGMDEAYPNFRPAPFTNYTVDQVANYYKPVNTNLLNQKDIPGMTQVVTGPDGQSYIRNNPSIMSTYTDDSFFGKLSDMAGNALPLSGFALAGLGASAIGGAAGVGGALGADALAAEIAGLTGSGVATGGAIGTGAVAGLETGVTGMDWFDELLSNYNPDAGFQTETMAEGLRDVSIGGNGLTGVPNLQDLMVSIDALPAGTGTLAKTLLGRVMSGQGKAEDWTSLLGILGATGLGVYGANQKSDALTKIADDARADRQPFLNKSLEWLNNPAKYYETEGGADLDATLRSLSVGSNPFGEPTKLALAGDIAGRRRLSAVTGLANLGLSGQDSRNSLLAGAAEADSGMFDALGYGLNQFTQPKQSLEDLMRALGIKGPV